jgi:hypothetical protein
MEWLGILLLYLISGFMKKREQNQKRKDIESEPDWDLDDSNVFEKPESDLGQLLNDLFEQNPKTPEASPLISDVINEESEKLENENTGEFSDEILEDVLVDDEQGLSEIDEKVEDFEDRIYHSKLADRRELHLGKKWDKQTNLRLELFNSKKTLKRAIILKEILDKPLALRK